MNKKGTILVVDDKKAVLSALKLLLGNYFETIILSEHPDRIPAILKNNDVDVVLLDMNFRAMVNTGNEGLFWLGEIKKADADIQVVVFTAYADIDLAVEAIKRGASDFVVKPWDNGKLVASMLHAFQIRKSGRDMERLREMKEGLMDEKRMYWGTGTIMTRLHEIIKKVSSTDANILITGENGTGKEMLAREIHLLSERRKELFVSVDMGAISETLFESELFGHVKGAFTDAVNDRAGKFEIADGGTLFLDEIANLPYHLQAKLLTVIQSRRIVRVGSNRPVDTNVRLICATNRDLEKMVADGNFREDLFYRINTIRTELPPLRKRIEDIIPLAQMFLASYSSRYGKKINGFSEQASNNLKKHPWPGNIRELQHTIEKAVIMCDGKIIMPQDLLLDKPRNKTIYNKGPVTLEEMEKGTIKEAVQRNEGNMSAVAKELGITRQTLYNKIKRYEL
ncbi:MAG: sigma-54 dependent transcriptional regulator [Bacteroidales bacterium]|jgi:DNA-binding NtrC family response regulator|nr:sigma-54 dependent transcriptional regulator [Bacteroidales bacterium]